MPFGPTLGQVSQISKRTGSPSTRISCLYLVSVKRRKREETSCLTNFFRRWLCSKDETSRILISEICLIMIP